MRSLSSASQPTFRPPTIQWLPIRRKARSQQGEKAETSIRRDGKAALVFLVCWQAGEQTRENGEQQHLGASLRCLLSATLDQALHAAVRPGQ